MGFHESHWGVNYTRPLLTRWSVLFFPHPCVSLTVGPPQQHPSGRAAGADKASQNLTNGKEPGLLYQVKSPQRGEATASSLRRSAGSQLPVFGVWEGGASEEEGAAAVENSLP